MSRAEISGEQGGARAPPLFNVGGQSTPTFSQGVYLICVLIVESFIPMYSDISAALAPDLAVDQVLKTITHPIIRAHTLTLWDSLLSQHLVTLTT